MISADMLTHVADVLRPTEDTEDSGRNHVTHAVVATGIPVSWQPLSEIRRREQFGDIEDARAVAYANGTPNIEADDVLRIRRPSEDAGTGRLFVVRGVRDPAGVGEHVAMPLAVWNPNAAPPVVES